VLGVVIYILYRHFCVKDDDRVHRLPAAVHLPQEDPATSQNSIPSCPHCRNVPSCPHCRNVPSCQLCRNVPSSPPPAYEVSVMGDLEWADLPCAM